jgi:opacity protein-like surface antigen
MEHIKQCGIKYDCHLHTHTLSYMGNLLCDLDCYPFKPYAGVGIGYVYTHGLPTFDTTILAETTIDSLSQAPELEKHDQDSFAWQIIAGVSYPLLSCLDIGIEYRYFQAKEEMENHSFGLALRTAF